LLSVPDDRWHNQANKAAHDGEHGKKQNKDGDPLSRMPPPNGNSLDKPDRWREHDCKQNAHVDEQQCMTKIVRNGKREDEHHCEDDV